MKILFNLNDVGILMDDIKYIHLGLSFICSLISSLFTNGGPSVHLSFETLVGLITVYFNSHV